MAADTRQQQRRAAWVEAWKIWRPSSEGPSHFDARAYRWRRARALLRACMRAGLRGCP
jgi:hypothetical protein